MDPNFTTSKPIKDTVSCILCNAVIRYRQKDKNKYLNHMRRDHGAFYNINLILIINLLGKDSLKLIQQIYREKHQLKGSGCASEVETRESAVQTEPITTFDAEVQTNLVDDQERKLSDAEFLNDIQSFVRNIQMKTKHVTDNQGMEESDISFSSNDISDDEDLYVPSDLELDEALPSSTSNSNQEIKIKEEKIDFFIPPDPSLDPIDVMLDGEDFNILDVTSEDFVMTAAGPRPIEDYSDFVPGAVIPPQYNPNEVIESRSEDIERDSESEQKRERQAAANFGYDLGGGRSKSKEKDQVYMYLKEESQYFKNTRNELSNSSLDRAEKFSPADDTLPVGWRWRIFTRKNGRVDYEYLSPEMKVLRSRVGVVEYMKAMGGYSDVELSRVLPVRIKKEKL